MSVGFCNSTFIIFPTASSGRRCVTRSDILKVRHAPDINRVASNNDGIVITLCFIEVLLDISSIIAPVPAQLFKFFWLPKYFDVLRRHGLIRFEHHINGITQTIIIYFTVLAKRRLNVVAGISITSCMFSNFFTHSIIFESITQHLREPFTNFHGDLLWLHAVHTGGTHKICSKSSWACISQHSLARQHPLSPIHLIAHHPPHCNKPAKRRTNIQCGKINDHSGLITKNIVEGQFI